ncbi:metal-dependent hydrolase [Nonomuraea sp. NPDC050405]
MGISHAMTGAVAWSALQLIHPQTTPVLVAGLAVTAGAALIPDLDHRDSTASRSLGPLTWVLCRVVQAVSGGHRRATHSLAGCATLAIAVQMAVQARPGVVGTVATAVLLAVILASVVHLVPLRAFKRGWLDEILAAVVAIALAMWPGLDLAMLGPAVLVGTLVHALGDAITRQGIPFWWPISRKNVRLARFKAGGWTERWVLRPAFVLAIPALLFWEPVMSFLGR